MDRACMRAGGPVRWVRTPVSTRVASRRCSGTDGALLQRPQDLDTSGRFRDDGWNLRQRDHHRREVRLTRASAPVQDYGMRVRRNSSGADEPDRDSSEAVLRLLEDALDRTVWCSASVWWRRTPRSARKRSRTGAGLRRERYNRLPGHDADQSSRAGRRTQELPVRPLRGRMRHETVQGNGPTFWLFSTRHATNPASPSVDPRSVRQGYKYPKVACRLRRARRVRGVLRPRTLSTAAPHTDDFFSGTSASQFVSVATTGRNVAGSPQRRPAWR